MAKKDFKDNPALQFISQAGEEEEDTQPQTEETEEGAGQLKAPTGEKPPKGYKLNPLYVETKSKRLQLVLQPSLYERIKSRAKEKGLSVNEYIHRALDKATREE